MCELCGDKLCVCKLCVDKLCVDKLCGDKLCVEKLCVDKVCGRRRADGRRQAGVQNQKQEPHTKMWGKISVLLPVNMGLELANGNWTCSFKLETSYT